jgi:hypothetical protein
VSPSNGHADLSRRADLCQNHDLNPHKYIVFIFY